MLFRSLEGQKEAIYQLIDKFRFARSLDKKRIDSLDKLNPKYKLTDDFRLFFGEENSGNYESFESSGKTVFIENKKLKKMILSYYKHQIPAGEKTGETFMNGFTKISDFIIKKIVVEKSNNIAISDTNFQTDLEIRIVHAEENIRIGDISIKKIQEIITEIDQELAE